MLHLSSQHLQAIATHAERTYPEECCGLLLGRLERQRESIPDDTRTLVEVWATENAWTAEVSEAMKDITAQTIELGSTKMSRFWIDPSDLLRGQRYARDRQLDIIGIYHSHPDHPAVPSECDRSLAWPQYSYIIVSVQQGSAQDLRCWSLDDRHQFQPEELLTVTPSPRSL
ncbi:M67 family metallopeptidase [Oculatella sp. LEGE 06141]|uniref:Mov34/MPN/PAD-1 family protein n=1 Tax=Oculatella sp. LEGE 06141 TaxID=1828648 RepID=UPI00187E45B7|nr:M67 family metallopeptidase [Oculatella sp. LEGE 06141]